MSILAIFAIFASISSSTCQSSASPRVLSHFCSLKGNNVTCTNVSSIAEANLTPSSLITSLVFTDCDIQQLEKTYLIDLNNTATLTITKCNVKNIENSSFSELKALTSLDLSWNKIANVTAEMFANSSTLLTALSLAGNPIIALPQRIFVNMMQLRKINLSHCQLMSISEYAFLSLHYLELIDLSSNNLTTQNKIVFESNDTLLNISDNYWTCDCSLLWIRQLRVTIAECYSPPNVMGMSVTTYECIDDSSSSGVVAAVIVPLVIVGVIIIACWLFCHVRQRRSSSQRQSHRYSAVYRETVEQSAPSA